MNRKIVRLVIILLLFSLSCSKQRKIETPKWLGKIEYENRVKVVKNPNEAVYGELTLDLEEDLSIGNEEDKNYIFYRVRDIELDNQRNIYVLDAGNYRIQKFDKSGNYLQTIGRKGQGPGEFETPYSFFIDFQNNLYISEGRKIQIFKNSGKYIRSIPLTSRIYDFFIDSQGNIIAHSFLSDGEFSQNVILKFDSKGKIIEKMAEFLDVKSVLRKDSRGSSFSFTYYHRYNYWLQFLPISDQIFAYAYPSEYRIFTINSDGNLMLKIEKGEPPHSISQKEKEYIIRRAEENTSRRGKKWPKGVIEEACQFPPHRPFFNRILVDNKGRIYVRRVKSVLEESEKVEFDIFSKDGYYLYKVYLPFTPEIIKKGYLYDIYTSEERGEVKIKRYKIKNWLQIKDKI